METTTGNDERKGKRSKKRILIVDDEPDITFTLKAGLENAGLFSVEMP